MDTFAFTIICIVFRSNNVFFSLQHTAYTGREMCSEAVGKSLKSTKVNRNETQTAPLKK